MRVNLQSMMRTTVMLQVLYETSDKQQPRAPSQYCARARTKQRTLPGVRYSIAYRRRRSPSLEPESAADERLESTDTYVT